MLTQSGVDVSPMRYPALGGAPPDLGAEPAAAPAEAERAEREERFGRELEAARREAFEKGRAAAAADQETWRKQCSGALAAAIEEFRARRDDYLSRVEREVVTLALAVAERILHREAQMDPLLLAGAVRVALGQLAESTEVRLRVPSGQQELWAEMLRLMPRLPLRPEVVGDAEMGACEAVLETRLGRVDLGVRAQIAEIERGFFDLLGVRAGDGGKQG